MREYEVLYIVNPELEDDRVKEVVEKFSGIVTRNGGEIFKIEEWGKQKLAYEVRRFSKGNFVLMDFVGAAGLATEVERNLRIDENILRYLTVKISDEVDPEKRRAEIATAKAKIAERLAREAATFGSPGHGDRDRDRDRDREPRRERESHESTEASE
jgi:small subunit ribosomal protein S6